MCHFKPRARGSRLPSDIRSLLLGAVGHAIDLNFVDAYFGEGLAMSLELLVLLLPLVMEDENLVATALAEHRSYYLRRSGFGDGAGITRERENVAELDGFTFGLSLLNLENV